MKKLQNSIVEDFGNGYAAFGHSDLMGRVVGLLLSVSEPISIDDMTEMLHISKSPVNQICRRLEELKLIRKSWVKGNRKYHYQIQKNVFLQASINLSRLNEGNLEIAEKNLALLKSFYSKASESEQEKMKILCNRLLLMREFYRKLLESYHKFIDEWGEMQKMTPGAEDFLNHENK